MVQLKFTKMHGLGNDFVVIDDLGLKPSTSGIITSEQAKKICDRRFGIGADQILWLKPPLKNSFDARMEVLNADGSVAEMCGNGIRAVGLYLNEQTQKKKSEYRIETLAGSKLVKIREDQVLVDMGRPHLGTSFATDGEWLEVDGDEIHFYEVDMGNPHAVIFVQNFLQLPVEKWGPALETHPRFPKRTNVEFVVVRSSSMIEVKIWERGAGMTLACGTGACAAAVASLATGKTRGPVQVHLPGGKLKIGWEGPETSVLMEGPAQKVFQGTLFLDS